MAFIFAFLLSCKYRVVAISGTTKFENKNPDEICAKNEYVNKIHVQVIIACSLARIVKFCQEEKNC